jgi:hypothetical protein
MTDSMERKVLKDLSESRSSTEQLNLDVAKQAQRLLASDPARQAERLIANDPARQAERQFRELEHMQKVLNPPIDTAEMERFVEMARPERNWDLVSRRDVHLDALADIEQSISSTARQQAENVQAAIVDHIRQQQEQLAEDQQLLVYCVTGAERIQVREIVLPNHHMLILKGVDGEGNPASHMVTFNNVNITSKVVKVPLPDKPYRIGFKAAD